MPYVSRSSSITPCFTWDCINGSYIGVAGTWATAADANQWLGRKVNNFATHGVNDAIALGMVYLPSTTAYRAYILSSKGNSYGIAHILLNNVDVGEIDLYAAGGSNNQYQNTNVGVLTQGYYSVVLKLSDKNAASSDYNMDLEGFSIGRVVI